MTGAALAMNVDSNPERWLATAIVIGAVLLASLGVRYVGRWLREEYDPRGSLLEAVQAALIVLLSAGAITAVLLIWEASQETAALVDAFLPTARGGIRALITLFLFLGTWGATVFLKRVIMVIFEERDAFSKHQREVGYHVVQIALYLVAGVATVAVWGINIGNILLGAGFLGIVLGLAARQTLASVLAGFVLLFGRPFDIGDWVLIDDREGVVTDVSIFNTELRTVNGEYVLLPNDIVTSTSIVNRSRRGRLRVDVEVGVDYDDDVDRARELATQAIADLDREEILEYPEPKTVLTGFGDSAVLLEARFWVDDPSAQRRWAARTAVVRAIKEAFEAEGITIPFPQRALSGRPAEGLTLQDGPRAGEGEHDG